MKLAMIALALLVTAWPAYGQQSTTDTNCYVNGQLVNCTSTTKTEPPPSGGWLAGVNKAMAANRAKAEANRNQNTQNTQQSPQLSPEAIKELLAEEKQERDAKETVDFIYCRQNPKGNITDSNGQPQACADVIAYTKAFCTVNTEANRCNLATSRTEVERAFADAAKAYNDKDNKRHAGNEEYFTEKFAKLTRWGCMSFPDMVLPQKDGSFHPCPNAPDPAALPADAPQPK
jgi:sarcosine oxidase delta subunit